VQTPVPSGQLLRQKFHINIEKSGHLFRTIRLSISSEQLLHNPLIGSTCYLQAFQSTIDPVQLFHGTPQSRLPRFPRMENRAVNIPEKKFAS
jgi:hypothetical protein